MNFEKSFKNGLTNPEQNGILGNRLLNWAKAPAGLNEVLIKKTSEKVKNLT